jgi:GNAT superfamily N-acetyltransferase
MSDAVTYAREEALDPAEFLDVLHRSGLAARRPVDDFDRIADMAVNANLVVTARDGGGLLVGVSRCVTDFAYCCYCSDLAVDRDWQGKGVGRELIARSRAELHPNARFYLISAPDAVPFYERIGMERVERCFRLCD